MRRPVTMAIGGGAAAALLLAAACGNNANKNNAKLEVAPNAPNVIIATAVPSNTPLALDRAVGTVAASPSALAAAGAQRLVEVATDNSYSQTTFTVKAGQPLELTLTNNGEALHNWHLLNVKDVDGKNILTPLVSPGQSATIDFTINTPGTYNFQCDVHPTDMKGTLTVH